MSSEAEIQARIRLAVGALPGVRLFRNNRGRAWMGKLIGQVGSTVTLAQPRHVEFGLVDGASDLIAQALGEKGPHARSTVGVAQLPLGACVEVEAMFEVLP